MPSLRDVVTTAKTVGGAVKKSKALFVTGAMLTGIASTLIDRRADVKELHNKIKNTEVARDYSEFLTAAKPGDLMLTNHLPKMTWDRFKSAPGSAIGRAFLILTGGRYRHASIYAGNGKYIDINEPGGTPPRITNMKTVNDAVILRLGTEKQRERAVTLAKRAVERGEYGYGNIGKMVARMGVPVLRQVAKTRELKKSDVNCGSFVADIYRRAGVRLQAPPILSTPVEIGNQAKPIVQIRGSAVEYKKTFGE